MLFFQTKCPCVHLCFGLVYLIKMNAYNTKEDNKKKHKRILSEVSWFVIHTMQFQSVLRHGNLCSTFFQCAWVVIIHSANTLLHIPKKKRKCLFILLWILKVIEDVLKCLKNKTVSGRLHIFQWAKEIEVVFAYFSHYILNCISSIKLPTRLSAWNLVKIGCRKKKIFFLRGNESESTKEGRWLVLTAPLGELDPVCGVLFTASR